MSALDGSVVNTILPVLKRCIFQLYRQYRMGRDGLFISIKRPFVEFWPVGGFTGAQKCLFARFLYFHRQFGFMRSGAFCHGVG